MRDIKRPYVICHMLPSIDGRIVTGGWNVKNATREYERTAATFGADAWIIGRISMEPYAGKARVPTRKNGGRIARVDFVAKHEAASYAIAIDPSGKLRWRANDIDGEHVITVLTVPRVPTLVLDPELALALFVAPVLLDSAFDASQRDLRKNWRTVAGLAIGAVVLTVVFVAVVAHALVPGLPWPAAIALGAIVAPPDAAAATAVLKQLRPPNRLLVILEGESLFNDTSALLIYRVAIAASAVGFASTWSFAATSLALGAGSIVFALVLARAALFISRHVQDVASAVIFQFCSTFAVWILAERLQLSAILTMVVFAMAVARPSAQAIAARVRVPSYAVWEVTVFVLNVLAFILVGFQLRRIVERAAWTRYLGVAAAVCTAVIIARIVWVSGAAAVSRWRCRPRTNGSQTRHDVVALSGRAASIVGWCGMRGIVTLAAALAYGTTEPLNGKCSSRGWRRFVQHSLRSRRAAAAKARICSGAVTSCGCTARSSMKTRSTRPMPEWSAPRPTRSGNG